MQESNNAITLIAVIGLIPLTSALLSLRNNDSFWGPNSSVGLSLILLAIFYFIQTYRSKKKRFKEIQQYINSHSNPTAIIEIVFTDSGISYKDFEMNFHVQWKFFAEYKLVKECLFITSYSSYISSVIIDRNEVTPAQFSELVSFVKNILPEGK